MRAVDALVRRELFGDALELGLSAAIIYLGPLQRHPLSTADLPTHLVLFTVPFPFIVWGADELRRSLRSRREDRQARSR